MIIQKALKGIAGIDRREAENILARGILCNWWRNQGLISPAEVPDRLTERNLDWHQNHYDDPDPSEGNEAFGIHTPFISLTAGSVERDDYRQQNILTPARDVALKFATAFGRVDGYVFYAYVFVLGRKSVPHPAFSEELRELNVYADFSPFQREGEVTAKIEVPPVQIERAEFYEIAKVNAALNAGVFPPASHSITNSLYQRPERIANLREVLL